MPDAPSKETTLREEGFYWVREPGQQPGVALWADGVWFLVGTITPFNDAEVEVLSIRLQPSEARLPRD